MEAFELDDDGLLAVFEADTSGAGRAVRLIVPSDTTPPWAALHRLATQGGTAKGSRGGRLIGRPGRAGGTPSREPLAAPVVRRSPGDQSHTSVVIDERSILKLYRRLTEGPNAEAEILAALDGVERAPVPAWHGSVDLELPGGATTALAIEQAFVPDVADAFEALADALARWLQGLGAAVSTDIPNATGTATGRLHVALAAVAGPAFGTRPAQADERATWLAAATASVDTAIAAVAETDPALAAWLAGARPAITEALRPIADGELQVRLQRIHGDLHLGQVLPAADGVLLVDFEGDPMRSPTERRARSAPLRDVANFLRSLDHVARSGFRRAAAAAAGGGDLVADAPQRLDAWLELARAAFLDGYRSGAGDPSWTVPVALLRALEVEKELGEFVYAARYLPDWLYAPAGGMAALLGIPAASEGRP